MNWREFISGRESTWKPWRRSRLPTRWIRTSIPIHYVRGQVLQKLGRVQEAKAEMEAVTRMMNQLRDQRQKELYSGPPQNPELRREPQ